MKKNIINKIKSAPKEPGVYIFREKAGVLYVGKAANLRNRLKSYLKVTDIKTQSLHEEATDLSVIILRSEIEALIEESRLIKTLRPKYNVLWMDDKSYLYVHFTNDALPKIFVTHQNLKIKNLKLKIDRIGPFTDGNALRLVMKILRRSFPYCTCLRPHLRDCLNAQIGFCPGVCCKHGVSTRRYTMSDYKHNIKMIKAILRGQSKKLLKTLERPEERLALEKIFEHQPFLGVVGQTASSEHPAGDLDWPVRYGVKPNGKSPRAKKGLPLEQTYSVSEKQLTDGSRVECYDNSNFAGKEAVGAMTALVKKDGMWVSDKNSYRKFKIKSSPTRDDPRMMYEIVSRRLRHPEWRYPELMIIDGGITQYRAAKFVFEKLAGEFPEIQKIKLISMAKPQKLVYGLKDNDETTPLAELDKELRQVIERAIYQTHHFVIRYHRNVRNREFLSK